MGINRLFRRLFGKEEDVAPQEEFVPATTKPLSPRVRRNQTSALDQLVHAESSPGECGRNTERKNGYDLSGLRQQVSETEYIRNLRIGRSWILPQMVHMGFVKSRDRMVFSIDRFESSIRAKYNASVHGRFDVWNLMKRNYRAIAYSDGKTERARWWTKDVAYDVMKWDFSLVGKASRGLDREVCIDILTRFPSLSDPREIADAIERYDRARMNRRRELHSYVIPESFVNAYIGDGAYSAMMTMVKVLGLRPADDAGRQMDRDESISYINGKAEEMTGYRLLRFCDSTFFESGLFDYKKYMGES